MAASPKRLGQAPVPAVSASATVATMSTASKKWVISKIILTARTVSGTARVKVYDVKSGASANDQVNLIKSIELAAGVGQTVEFGAGIILDTQNDFIAIATEDIAAGVITDGAITVYGSEIDA